MSPANYRVSVHAIFILKKFIFELYVTYLLNLLYDAGKWQIFAALNMLKQFICELCVTILSLYFRYDAIRCQVVAAMFMLKQFMCEL
jgi:hypothetical protein